MKPLVILNIALATILSAVIVLILVERGRARDRVVASSIESLERELIDQAAKDKQQIQQAWDEGFIASEKWRVEVVKSFAGSRGRLDPYYLTKEFNSRFWSGTNANPYWKQHPQ